MGWPKLRGSYELCWFSYEFGGFSYGFGVESYEYTGGGESPSYELVTSWSVLVSGSVCAEFGAVLVDVVSSSTRFITGTWSPSMKTAKH